MAGRLQTPETSKELDGIEQSIRYVAQHMPSHGEYLAQYCPARPV